MMKETSENGTDSSADDIGTIEEIPEDTILSRQTSVNLVPFIGQRFVSQDAAYEFYCSFAKQCGFSIRRHRTRGKDGVGRGVTRRDFTCHRGGYPQTKPSDEGKALRNRKSTRCGCQAYMRIVKRADFDVPEWRITGFSNIHNHDVLKSNDIHALPAYCVMSADDKSRICMFAKAGMSVRQMLRLLELEKGVKLGCLPFTEIDVRNLLQSIRHVDRDSDAMDLLKLCKDKKDKDPNFKYNFKIDANNRLDYIAWTYSSSVQSFNLFGDLLVFDTTHRLDSYDMLLGIFLGVDNHGSNCFFGCVLLRDENMDSFCWALKTFLSFMNGKVPETILTDQNMWLKEAVAIEMPRTKHAFFIWQIMSKFSEWFSVVLGTRYDEWKVEFHGIYNLQLADEFELVWREMVERYGLHGNKHIVSLYALRTYWALPFLRCYFFAGMTSTLQPEAINAFIQRFLSAQSVLDNFVEQVAVAMESKDQSTPKQKTIQRSQKPCLKTGSPIESHASTILTPYAFSKLQQQLVLAPQYASLLVDESYFVVRHHTESYGGSKVIWIPDDEFISCSCHEFEFSGILCRHVLRVLSTNNCFNVPYQYLPIRWRDGNDQNAPGLLQSMVSSLVSEAMETEERLTFVSGQVNMVLTRVKEYPGYGNGTPEELIEIVPEVEDSDSMSVVQGFSNVGKLKERRLKRGGCGQFGQGSSDCPGMGNGDMNGDGMGFL